MAHSSPYESTPNRKVQGSFNRPRRAPLAEVIYCQLRDAILEEDYAPGDALPSERRLSEQLGANRGAIREALKRLEQARLVRIQHGGKTTVLDYRETATLEIAPSLMRDRQGRLDVQAALGAVELRTTLQGEICRLAAQKASQDALKLIRERLEQLHLHADDDEFIAIQTESFWRAVARATGSITHVLTLNSLLEVSSSPAPSIRSGLATVRNDFESLERIVVAIEEGDGDRAAAESMARGRVFQKLLTELFRREANLRSGSDSQ